MKQAVDAGTPLRCACGALVKPGIVFFGEPLPRRFFNLAQRDFPQCDLLLVMGTSLVVQPFASLIGAVSPDTPRLLINREKVAQGADGRRFNFEAGNYRDVFLGGNCDDGCEKLASMLGWEAELEAAVAQIGLAIATSAKAPEAIPSAAAGDDDDV